MVIVFFLVYVLLSCLPFLHSTTDRNTSTSTCPESFSCPNPNFARFKYPFYNTTHSTRCGLINVRCTPDGGNITIGGQSYVIHSKIVSDSVVNIYNRTFENLVNETKCEALTDNFTSPSPLLYSISIQTFITLFKCSNAPNYTTQLDAHFPQSNYNNSRCNDHNFYYKYPISDTTLPSEIPATCQVIQLPVKLQSQKEPRVLNGTNIFSLLTSNFSISIKLSHLCNDCHHKQGRCHTQDGRFKCLNAQKSVAPEITKPPKEPPQIIPRHRKQIRTIGLCIGLVILVGVMILCFLRKLKWRIKAKTYLNVETFLESHEFLAKRYTYLQVKKMTNSFEVKLGQGGFGSVYKGELSNGSLVAVKILSELKGNGEDFINEVASIGRTSHVNIVSLVGFCFEGHQRALIYEFMPNGSLEKFIYDRASSFSRQLGWEKLHAIAIGIARGLEYLHSGCNTRILHFDIKPHNILLDQDFSPKISDFGLAKLSPEKTSMISMSLMRGTPGYIAPELFSRSFGCVSHKSDVYSYGMMIFEMVGGRKNVEVGVVHTSEIYFPHWIYKKVELDEELGLHTSMSDEENKLVRKMIIVGLWCIQTNPLSRPTITKALEMLEGDLEFLEIPPKPYLSSPSRPVSFSLIE